MALHRQLNGSLCARSSSSQRNKLWPFCHSLLQTWAWHCLLRTWWCLQSSSGIQGYKSWRGWVLDAAWRALGEEMWGQETFFRVFLLSLRWLFVQTPWAWTIVAGYTVCWLENIAWKGNMLLFLDNSQQLPQLSQDLNESIINADSTLCFESAGNVGFPGLFIQFP